MNLENLTGNINTVYEFNFFKLSEAEKSILEPHAIIKKYKKNEVIYSEDSLPKGAYYLTKGLVKINRINQEEFEQILFFFAENELFGYRYLLSKEKHYLSAICIEESEIKFIPADNFLQIINDSHDFTKKILERVSYEFTILIKRLNLFATNGIKARIAFTLLLLEYKFSHRSDNNRSNSLTINRINIAAFSGTSIDVVSRNLRIFEENRWISCEGKNIIILDQIALKNIVKLF